MRVGKSPGAMAALGASVSDRLGQRVISEINRRRESTQADACPTLVVSIFSHQSGSPI